MRALRPHTRNAPGTGLMGRSSQYGRRAVGLLSILTLRVYDGCMARTTIDIDDQACAEVMRRYRLATNREAIDLALRMLVAEPASVDEVRSLRGIRWEGDLDAMRSTFHRQFDAQERMVYHTHITGTASRRHAPTRETL